MDPLYKEVLKKLKVSTPEEAIKAAEKALHEATCAYQEADKVLAEAQVALRDAYNNLYLTQEFVK